MPTSTHFRYEIGQDLSSPLRPGKVVTFTPLMQETLPVIRGVLIRVAQRGETITYGDLVTAIDGRYHNQQLGTLLDVVSQDCEEHGEPSLAPLVVAKATGVPGDEFVGDPLESLKACHAHWQSR